MDVLLVSAYRGVGVLAVDVVLVGEGAGHAVGAAAGAAGAAVTPHVAHAAAELVDDLHALAVAAAAPRARVVAEARRVADLVERRAVHTQYQQTTVSVHARGEFGRKYVGGEGWCFRKRPRWLLFG